MTRKAIENRIKSIISEITGHDEALLQSEIYLSANEQSDKAINICSLELAELLMTIHEEFDVEIPDEKVSELNTIERLVDYIAQATL